MHKNKIAFSAMAIIAFIAQTVNASIPPELEPTYAEAILAYHKKDYPQAIKLTDEALSKEAGMLKFLELKALAQKSAGLLDPAYKTYQELINASTKQNRPAMERVPYQFELGMLSFQQKRYLEARLFFEKTRDTGFNRDTTHYLMGILDFVDSKWDSSEKFFLRVLKSKVEELKPASYLYLGQIAGQKGDSKGVVKNLVTARRLASQILEPLSAEERAASMAEQVRKTSEGALASLDRSTLWGSVGLVTSYDTNVLLNPNLNSSSSSGASNFASVKETLQLGFGYASSPVKKIQLLPSYRGSLNYNFNSDTSTGQYFVNLASLQVTDGAMDTSMTGAKVEVLYIMRFGSGGGTFDSYSGMISVGPFYREDIDRHSHWGAEVFLQPQHFFQDAELDADLRTSGWGGSARIYRRNETPYAKWNPGFSLQAELRNTLGSEFRSKGAQLEFQNYMHFSKTLQMTPFAQAGLYLYGDRADGSRTDILLTFGTSAVWQVSQPVSLMASLQATANLSNVADTYSYSRLVGSVGATYSF